MELREKRMRRSKLINLTCENVEDLVVLSARGYRSVVFRNSTIATLKMIKDDDEEDNLGTALDVVATHIKMQCSMMDYKHQTYHTNTSKEIAEESAPDTLQQLQREMFIGQQFLPSLLIGNITSAIKKHTTPFQITLGCTSTKRRRSSTCMTISSAVRMMSCCASRTRR